MPNYTTSILYSVPALFYSISVYCLLTNEPSRLNCRIHAPGVASALIVLTVLYFQTRWQHHLNIESLSLHKEMLMFRHRTRQK